MLPVLQHLTHRTLEVTTSGAAVEPLLHEFAELIQADYPRFTIGITVIDQPGSTFQYAVFPRLPYDFTRHLIGIPYQGKKGSCGRAVFRGELVDVPDVQTDERFSDEWRQLFGQYGLGSIVSMPALRKDGHAQGCMAIIHEPGKPPTIEEHAALQSIADLLAMVCTYSRTYESNKIVVNELEHRMRNLFTTVGAMAVMTMRSHTEPKAFRNALGERLVMMQRAHSLGMNAQEIDLATLLREVLAAYSVGIELNISGPHIKLLSSAAEALALAVYELGTNAAKYGSLSQPGGALDIAWSITPGDALGDPDCFIMTWQERNGPEVSPPQGRGYGSTVISSSLRNAFEGHATLNYDSSGFNCLITAPFTAQIGCLQEIA